MLRINVQKLNVSTCFFAVFYFLSKIVQVWTNKQFPMVQKMKIMKPHKGVNYKKKIIIVNFKLIFFIFYIVQDVSQMWFFVFEVTLFKKDLRKKNLGLVKTCRFSW